MNIIKNTLKNFFRTSVVSIPIITLIIGIAIFDLNLIILFFGLCFTLLLNYLIKFTIGQLTNYNTRKYFLRPPNAKGCDACCSESLAGNKIGFPSGHSQLCWFFSTYLFFYSYFKYQTDSYYLLPFLIIFASSISISRLGWLGNQCHTPIQVILGAFLGSISSYYYFIYFQKVVNF